MIDKRIADRLIPISVAAAVLLPTFFMHSCANTTQAPTGGAKDSIPPALYWTDPVPGSIGVGTSKAQFTFGFDEYVKVKNAQNVFLSPPQKKMPKTKIKGRNVVVYFEEDLLPNTTYTIDFTDAIADNNEGNMFPGYTYVFSTGTKIDSMMVTGTIRDCNTLKPVKGATVMLYKDHSDSAVFKSLPSAATKTDEWGYFAIPYLKDTLYRMYALKDDNNDNLFQPESDLIGFADSLIRPVMVVNDTLKELQKFDPKDTLNCEARKSEYEILLFKEILKGKQNIVNAKRVDERKAYVKFLSPYVYIDSLWIKGYRADQLITQFNLLQDSLEIWVNDRRRMPDTLNLYINYMKSNDTTLAMVPDLVHKKLYIEGAAAKRKAGVRKEITHKDTICDFSIKAEPETVEQKGFELVFTQPLINARFDSLKFYYINPKQVTIDGSFSVERDSMDVRRYVITPKEKMLPGYEYHIDVPERVFRDINGFYSDSTKVNVKLPDDDKLSAIETEISGVSGKLIVDLLNEKKDVVLRQYVITSDSTLRFPYLKEGKYSVRFTFDENGNSIVDTGCLLEHRQPERVVFFKYEDGQDYIELAASSEFSQKIDIRELK